MGRRTGCRSRRSEGGGAGLGRARGRLAQMPPAPIRSRHHGGRGQLSEAAQDRGRRGEFLFAVWSGGTYLSTCDVMSRTYWLVLFLALSSVGYCASDENEFRPLFNGK